MLVSRSIQLHYYRFIIARISVFILHIHGYTINIYRRLYYRNNKSNDNNFCHHMFFVYQELMKIPNEKCRKFIKSEPQFVVWVCSAIPKSGLDMDMHQVLKSQTNKTLLCVGDVITPWWFVCRNEHISCKILPIICLCRQKEPTQVHFFVCLPCRTREPVGPWRNSMTHIQNKTQEWWSIFNNLNPQSSFRTWVFVYLKRFVG